MIKLTRLNGAETWLSADLVATVEERPDTVVTLVDGNHVIVTESAREVVSAITAYRASVLAVACQPADHTMSDVSTDAGAPATMPSKSCG